MKWKYNIAMVPKEIECLTVDLIHLTQSRSQGQDWVNTVTKLQMSYVTRKECVDHVSYCHFLKDCTPWSWLQCCQLNGKRGKAVAVAGHGGP